MMIFPEQIHGCLTMKASYYTVARHDFFVSNQKTLLPKMTLKNCTLPPVCNWGYRLQSHFSSRLLSESEWRTAEAGPIFSSSLYFRPAKKAKTAFNNITIGKEGHKDQMCNNLFSLFVADIIILFLFKTFFKFQLFFSKISLKILLFVLIYGQLSGTESTFTWKSRNLDPHLLYPTG